MLTAQEAVNSLTTNPVVNLQQTKAAQFYEEYVRRYALDPDRFVREALGMTPTWQQQQLIDCILDESRVAIRSGHGSGKALPQNQLVKTDDGWREIGNVKVGDLIYTQNGCLTEVLGVYPQPQKNIYRITTDDGGSVEACEEHLWTTYSRSERKHGKPPKVRTTLEIKESLTFPNGVRSGLNHQLPQLEAIRHSEKDLPIEPYVLGALLGDGSNTRITTEHCVIEELEAEGVALGLDQSKTSEKIQDRTVLELSKHWRTLGLHDLRSWEKFVPKVYLFGSIAQRISLLQGLMDTDGMVSNNGLEFDSSSRQLADDISELVFSLGGVARRSSRIPKLNGVEKRESYRVYISLPDWVQPFRHPRKVEGYQPQFGHKNRDRTLKRHIKSVEFLRRDVSVCIKVANPSELFVTNDHILTHNSTISAACMLWFGTTRPFSRVLATGPNISILHKVLWPELAGRFYQLGKRLPALAEMFAITRTSFFHREFPQQWFMISRTAAKNNSQGLAGQHSRHLLIIVEEASAVDEEIFSVLDGALTSGKENKLLMVGNPTRGHGRMYEAFHSRQDTYKLLHWNGEESPLVSEEMIELFKQEYGEGSNDYRVRVEGEFAIQTSGMLISRNEAAGIQANEFEFELPPMTIISVDVAGSGRDSSVIMILKVTGDEKERLTEIVEIREFQINKDTVQLAGEVAFLAREHVGCKVIVDSVGVGTGVSDFLAHNDIDHIALNSGQPSWYKDRFINQRAESFAMLREGLIRGHVKGPRNLKLFDQLSNIPYDYNERGKLQLLSKARMATRGIRSPDLADALSFSFLCSYEPPGQFQAKARSKVLQTPAPEEVEVESELFGPAMQGLPIEAPPGSAMGRNQSERDPLTDFLNTDW